MATIGSLAIGVLSLLGQSASANLVTNGTFDTDLSGWTLVANDGFTGFQNTFAIHQEAFRMETSTAFYQR